MTRRSSRDIACLKVRIEVLELVNGNFLTVTPRDATVSLRVARE